MMEILKGIEIRDKALWIKKHKILVIGDLHIGYEESLAKSGVLIPKRAFSELKSEMQNLLLLSNPKKIIITGDFKHEFSGISDEGWRDASSIIELMKEHCDEIILIKGNHDKAIEPLAMRLGMNVVDHYFIEESVKEGRSDIALPSMCFLHGDRIIENKDTKEASLIIIGHEHPAITLREGEKNERYKCFLSGKWKGKDLIVLPSFFSLIEGTDLNNERLLSPYLHQDIGKFEVYVIGDRTYKFGRLKDIK